MLRAPAGAILALRMVAMFALVACSPVAAGSQADVGAPHARLVRLTFLQVNDVYSIEPVDGGRRGGMARLATLVKAIKGQNPDTLFVLAGDTLSPSVLSTYLKGAPMIAAFNAARLDLATFGNHEFDFGPEVLRQRMAESKFLWISSNVIDRRTGLPFGGARPSLIRTMGAIPVGLFGITSPETAVTSSPGSEVLFQDPLAVGKEAAADLRRRGAKLLVAITHQDMPADKALAASAQIDLILGGHEHEPLVAEEGKAVITKAGSDARYLVQVDLWMTPQGELVERSWTFHEVSRRISPDPEVEALAHAATRELDRELGVAIGRTAVPLEGRRSALRTRETNLGNLVADLMRERMGTDVALINGGGIRADGVIPPGPITKRDVHALLPFTNVLMKLEMRGRDLRQALEHGLAQADREGGGFLQVSGLRITHDPRRPPGGRVLQVDVGGKPLEDQASYTVAAIDYLVRGRDGFTFFRGAKVLVNTESGPQLADVVPEGITARGTIAPQTDGRIRAVQN